jgi:hypothetical protein
MFIFSIILIFLFTSISLVVVKTAKLRYAIHWFIAAGGVLAAWLLISSTGFDLPQTLPLVGWQPENLFSLSPSLLIDRYSWSYAQALVTLLFAVILTDVVRGSDADWSSSWAACLVLTALGLFAVLSGNLITLLLAWMAIDIVELLLLLSKINQSSLREKVVVTFSARTISSVLVMVAVILSSSQSQDLTFTNVPLEAGAILLLAAGFRLGVIPIHIPSFQSFPLNPGMGTILRMVSAAAGLILLVRTAPVLPSSNLTTIFVGLAALAVVYSGITWLFAKNEIEGRPAWIVGMASLSFASATQGQALASLSWGLSALLGGGLLFLFSKRNQWLIWIPLTGLIAISTLPFTPNWNGAMVFSQPFTIFYVPLLFGQVLILLGYARHVLRPQAELEVPERWSQFIYPLGLLFLLGTLFWLGLLISPPIQTIPLHAWFTGVVGLGLAAFLFTRSGDWKDIPPDWVVLINSVLSFQWLYRSIWALYRSTTRILGVFTRFLEGEGGVLWAILLIGLLFILLTRIN